MEEELREYIRLVLEEKRHAADNSEDVLLVEPDESEEDAVDEKGNPLAMIQTVLSIASMAKSLAS